MDDITVATFFFFNDTATTEIYTLSLHDALPIFSSPSSRRMPPSRFRLTRSPLSSRTSGKSAPARRSCMPIFGKKRSEEHTSELQSRHYIVCRLLLEKKKVFVTVSKTFRLSPPNN